MGGDRAPQEIVAGALAAASDEVAPILYGPQERLDPIAGGLEIVHTEQVVAMHEKPSDAVREKRESSLFLACRAVREGTADAVVGAGNTGAMLAAALVEIRRLPDVHRPAIAVPIPALGGPSILVDAGANADARPEHLVQFAHMGAVFAEEIVGLPNPTVALLSIGEEPEKGNRLVREAHAELASTPGLNFVGNVEGRDLLRKAADVVVCDGFTGNITLKLLEGTIQATPSYAAGTSAPNIHPAMFATTTIANDVTVRDFVHNFYRPPVKAKGWDTFCPIGPVIVEDEIADPHRLGLRAFVNGELRQQANTRDLIFGIPRLIELYSHAMTLHPGDVIATGTPEGVGRIAPGDEILLSIERVGDLRMSVCAPSR